MRSLVGKTPGPPFPDGQSATATSHTQLCPASGSGCRGSAPPVMAISVAGGEQQEQAAIQIILNYVELGMSLRNPICV